VESLVVDLLSVAEQPGRLVGLAAAAAPEEFERTGGDLLSLPSDHSWRAALCLPQRRP